MAQETRNAYGETLAKLIVENKNIVVLDAEDNPVACEMKQASVLRDGVVVDFIGAQNIVFAQLADPNTIHLSREYSIYFSGAYPIMLFGIPAACYAIYKNAKEDNKILRVNIKGEKGLINVLRSFEDFTQIYRAIPEFDKYEYSVGMDTSYVSSFYHNKPFALIVSDGEMLAYATATGNARGMVKNVDRAIFTERLETGFAARPSGDNSSKASTYLTAASASLVFVITSHLVTAAMLESASPRNPSECRYSRSLTPVIFPVACLKNAFLI